MNKSCQSCKHWRAAEGEKNGICKTITFGDDERAIVADDPNCGLGTLITREDFFCVLWEPKEGDSE